MIEDFFDDPKGELRWFGWALLLFVALTFAAALVVYGIDATQRPAGAAAAPALAIAGGAVEKAMYATLIPAPPEADILPMWSNPLFGLLALIGLFVARNFLSAFRHHRPHTLAIAGIAPLFYVGLAEIGAPGYVVFGVTITAVIWTLLLPIPHSEERMGQAARGLAVGLVSAVTFQLGGVVVAAAYAGWMLYRRRFIEAALTGIAGALAPLVYVSGALALDRTDTNAILYGLMLSVVLIEGFIGLLADSFVEPREQPVSPDKADGADGTAEQRVERVDDAPLDDAHGVSGEAEPGRRPR